MIKCSFCQATYVDNTLFCSECGNYLPGDNTPPTDPLDTDELGWQGQAADDAPNNQVVQPGQPEPVAVRLKIGPKKRQVEVALDRPIHLGRMDPASSVLPEVDLTVDDLKDKGISRRHARIKKEGAHIFVEDLGSINGTYVNGKRLSSFLPETLDDGDILQLGKLLIEVRVRKE